MEGLQALASVRRLLGFVEVSPSTRLRLLGVALRTTLVRRMYSVLGVSVDKLPRQSDLIREGDYDVLVILDACRYDYLAASLRGSVVQPVVSPASTTPTWLSRTWRDASLAEGILYTYRLIQ